MPTLPAWNTWKDMNPDEKDLLLRVERSNSIIASKEPYCGAELYPSRVYLTLHKDCTDQVFKDFNSDEFIKYLQRLVDESYKDIEIVDYSVKVVKWDGGKGWYHQYDTYVVKVNL